MTTTLNITFEISTTYLINDSSKVSAFVYFKFKWIHSLSLTCKLTLMRLFLNITGFPSMFGYKLIIMRLFKYLWIL